MNLKCDVLVIGGGPGGYSAAFRAADLGKNVILVEKHKVLGGVCLNVGCIPSKTLLHITHIINEANTLNKYGVSFNEPIIDFHKIQKHKQDTINKLTNGLSSLAKQRNVKIIQGIAEFASVNTVNVMTDNKNVTITFEKAIIAVGSRNKELPNISFSSNIIDSTQALNLEKAPESILIIGGGIIGLEMAEIYSTLGSKITIVELNDHIIPPLDQDLARIIETQLRKKYTIYTKTACQNIEDKKNKISVTINNTKYDFSKALIAIGRMPNSTIIKPENAGIKVDKNGYIKVDKTCKTNIDNIYAIGDVIGQPMLAHKAIHEGKIAAENCSNIKSYCDIKVIPSVAYISPEVSWIGITEKEAKEQNKEISVGKFPWMASGRSLSTGKDYGITKIIVNKENNQIIGAGIVGDNAGELINELSLAIEMCCTIEDVILTVHAHPTLSETIPLSCEIINGSITDLLIKK